MVANTVKIRKNWANWYTKYLNQKNEELVDEISVKIIKTQNSINKLKSDLYRVLNQLYD